jgi:hypothetical protein
MRDAIKVPQSVGKWHLTTAKWRGRIPKWRSWRLLNYRGPRFMPEPTFFLEMFTPTLT